MSDALVEEQTSGIIFIFIFILKETSTCSNDIN